MARSKTLTLGFWIPIKVKIKDPIAAMDSFIADWGDQCEDPSIISANDLILHAEKLGNIEIVMPDEVDVDFIYGEGTPEIDEYLKRQEL